MDKIPKRKSIRLPGYDYRKQGAYFITIDTKEHKELFWDASDPVILSKYGEIAKDAIKRIPVRYPMISVDHYVIMPNHIHLLLQIHEMGNGRSMIAPTVSVVVQQMKGYVTKKCGFPAWQKSFYEHVIRGDADYSEIWQYIENNPQKWILQKNAKNHTD